ncbi:hypothetical protein QL285_070111 [Trifolium repens]|nr:hypothetical protein QL285_070111 [Trifolium repens]
MSSNQICIQGPSLGSFVTIHLENEIFPPNMQQYINQNLSSHFIVLSGKKGKKLDATINHDYSDEPYIYIGEEWKLFCIRNNFKIGDIIRFKFAKVNISHMVHVFKIDI